MDNCELCKPTEEKFLVYSGKHWRIELHGNQYYLGRCAIVCNEHLEDLFDISDEGEAEFFKIGKALRDAIRLSFKADLLNYASLGNSWRHLHFHVIPRYSHTVEFAGQEFSDAKWGSNYSGYPKDFAVSDDVLLAILDSIKSNLKV